MQMQTFEWSTWLIASGGVVSLLCSIFLIITKHLHGRISLDSLNGVHKFHTEPTPRIGGLAILAGLIVSWWVFRHASSRPEALFQFQPIVQLLGPMLLAAAPAFAFGMLEDLTKRVGVLPRLFATMVSGLLAWWLTDVSITRVDLWGIDALLAYLPISVAFTAFAVGGVANAFNIIDGFNGLAAGSLIISLTAIGCIAQGAGDPVLAQLCLVLGIVVFGFGAVNFPLGKIFLGDGGAYLLGFLVAWTAVLLPMRNREVSVWAALLTCGYPVLEVLFSVWRKHCRIGSNPGQPDKVHLHMLFYKRVSRRVFAQAPPALQNGLSSIFAWSFAVVPAAIAVIWSNSTGMLIGGFLTSAALYRLIYLRLTQFRWCVTPNTRKSSLGIRPVENVSEDFSV